jgi:DNA polymerase (family 10)
MLELMEGNPFRVRAYRRAALGVLFLPRQLSDYFGSDEPAPLPGVGERMRKRLGELINTGHMGVQDALLEEIGEPMLSLLAVDGIGPKRAIRLISGLEVSSLQSLAAAARAGRIRELRGFGPRSEARILAAVEAVLGEAA